MAPNTATLCSIGGNVVITSDRKRDYNNRTIFIHVDLTSLAEMPREKNSVQGILLPFMYTYKNIGSFTTAQEP
jgi:hypothetical protein